jgi:FMN phosphatase YigB (HAD superfamily)
MIKAIFFDLDFCIFDTRSLGEGILDPVLAPLYASSLPEELQQTIASTLWSTSLEDTIALFNLEEPLADAMREAHQDLVVPDTAHTYGDENTLNELLVYRVLVTSGYQAWQEAKLARLNIAHIFDEIIIDTVDDAPNRKGKQVIFSELLTKHGWQPDEVLVVGDNPHSELKAARALGITTVQTLRPTVTPDPLADHRITSLSELASLITNAPDACGRGPD